MFWCETYNHILLIKSLYFLNVMEYNNSVHIFFVLGDGWGGWNGSDTWRGVVLVAPPNINVRECARKPPLDLLIISYVDGTSTMIHDKR